MKPVTVACLGALVALALAGSASAQGLQTGLLQGTVNDNQGLVMPGVTVTVSSPALQGTRNTVSDENGAYVLRGLPPGAYNVSFELSGFKTVQQPATVELGKQTQVNATMSIEGLAETVNVTAEAITSAIASTTGGQNLTYNEVVNLPTNRTPYNIATLAPNVTTNTPNANQLTISGAFAYDNVFLVDGVDINDNLFGTANNLYIEDAIEETQVLTSGISAEYGRFSGGVVNAISKSGGDTFSGSYRLNLTNDKWTTQTPYEVSHGIARNDNLNTVHEATVGGPLVRTKLWFFGAGRYTSSESSAPLPLTAVPFTTTDKNQRGEVKLTGTLAQNHTFTFSYLDNSRDVHRLAFATASIDPNAAESPSFPNDRWVGAWRGVLSPKLFADVRYSQKHFGFRNSGGTNTNLVQGSPFWTLSEGYAYNAPYFDATDPEDRDNRQFAGSLSYFLTTPRLGSHDVKGGLEDHKSRRTGGNSQSPTGYVFDADILTDVEGSPIADANGKFIPVWQPGASYVENWIATRGAQLDINTTSFFLQDRWQAGKNLTVDLGLRYERVRSEATGGIVGVDTDTIVPRLGATYDVKGDGRFVFQGTYAHYSGKYSEAQFGGNASVGNPSYVYTLYTGPAGQGLDFAPAFDLGNYTEVFQGQFPTANVIFNKGLSSPLTKEFTVSFGSQIGRKGYGKVTFLDRTMSSFVEDFIDLTNGFTFIPQIGQELTNAVYANSDVPQRDYRSLDFVGRYQLTSKWQVAGNWTIQLKNEGNFPGEAENQPGLSSLIGNYPEIYSAARNYPVGRMPNYERNRVRAWTVYDVGMGRFGTADVSLLYRFDSPQVYSLSALNVPLSTIQQSLGAAYADLPANQTLFFGARGSEEWSSQNLVDLGVNYAVPVFRTLRPYIKVDLFNLFNASPQIGGITTVRPDPNSPLDALGLPTGYITAGNFGQARSNASYPLARTFQMAVGFRF